MNKGYENSACDRNGREVGARPTTVEMVRVAGVAKCCGGRASPGGKPTRTVQGPACPPKCPAVSSSPWDPIKTWLAIVLSVAMLVWAGLGVYFIKFRSAQ